MSQARLLNVVVAACDSMGIGVNGKLPWRLKQDMAFFKKLTTTTTDTEKKNVVIMGKNTWLSIPPKFRPLSGRINIVLSKTLSDVPEGVHVAKSFNDALYIINDMSALVQHVFVIGGASVYKDAMFGDYPCRVYLTQVDGQFECDTYLPNIDKEKFSKVINIDNVPDDEFEENGIKFRIVVYEKCC